MWCFLSPSSEGSDPDTPSPYGDWSAAPLSPQFTGLRNAGEGEYSCPGSPRQVMAINRRKEAGMLEALKKLIGADEEGKKRRRQALEEEERERRERARGHANKLKHDADQVKQADQEEQ